MVVSGINEGENLGDDVLYSGTVAAAIEGRFLGLSAVAISLAIQPESDRNFSAAAEVSRMLIQQLLAKPPQQPLILNVNVPDLPLSMIKGFRSTRLGFRHRSEPLIRAKDPRGRPVYWVGPAGSASGRGRGHRLPRHPGRLRFRDPPADRSHAPCGHRGRANLAGRLEWLTRASPASE